MARRRRRLGAEEEKSGTVVGSRAKSALQYSTAAAGRQVTPAV